MGFFLTYRYHCREWYRGLRLLTALASSSDLGPGALRPRRQERRHRPKSPQPAAGGRSLPRAGVGTRSWHPVWCPTGICQRTHRRKQEGQKGPVKGRNSSGFPVQEPCSLQKRRFRPAGCLGLAGSQHLLFWERAGSGQGEGEGKHGAWARPEVSVLSSEKARAPVRVKQTGSTAPLLAQPRGQQTADSQVRS